MENVINESYIRKAKTMINKKVFVCGNFGYKKNQVDGQTLKTRIAKEALEEIIGKENIDYLDTSYVSFKKINWFFDIRNKVRQSQYVIILPGRNGLTMLLPFFIVWRQLYKFNLHYIVIGGWLSDYLKNKGLYKFLCSKLDGIHVETYGMQKNLNLLGLHNVYLLNNMKKFKYLPLNVQKVRSPLKFIFLSRVMKEKGVEIAIEVINKIDNIQSNSCVFHIYGPITEEYHRELGKIISDINNPNIEYKGFIDPSDINYIMSQYDILLFPTYYEGEGFPGVIIDAHINGLAIIASNWKYNCEIIQHEYNGMIFNNPEQLYEIIIKLLDNPALIDEMKKNSLNCAQNYNAIYVMNSFVDNFLKLST